MRKQGAMLLLTATLILGETPVEAALSVGQLTHTTYTRVASGSIGRRRKGAKPRRGGLFNTGLFRKKNPCGCPSH